MLLSRRSLVAVMSIAAAAPWLTNLAEESRPGAAADPVIGELLRLSEQANAAFMRGDMDAYRALVTLSDDFTLMSPFGGTPTHRGDIKEESWTAMARAFQNGTLTQDLVQAYRSPDMVVLAVIEHGYGEVHGLPAQAWPLRVTLVYRRDGDKWHLVHRHADPLVAPVPLQQAAALARR
jgi:ketosteroid isomerase-like protein